MKKRCRIQEIVPHGGLSRRMSDCPGEVETKGLCHKHYMAFWRYGSAYGAKAGKRLGYCAHCHKEMRIYREGQKYHKGCWPKSAVRKEQLARANRKWRAKRNAKGS